MLYETTELLLPSVPGSGGGDQIITTVRNATVSEAMQISTDRLKETPFFGPFADNSICTSNAISGIYTPLLAQLLADAIPAESLPAGYTNVPAWESDQCENNELSCVKYRDEIMKGVLQNYEWKHSFFISVPYSVVRGLYEEVSQEVKEDCQ